PDAGASRAERAPALARRDARRAHRRQRGPGHDRERLHPRRTGARGRPARDLGPGPRLHGHGRRARRRRALGRGTARRRGRPARGLMDVTGRTLLQRLAAPDVLSRVFGLLEGSSMAALAIGALAAPVLVERLGSAAAFAAIGALLPVLLVIALPALRTADRRARVPERTLAIARRVPFFAALPAPSLERVAEALRPVEARAG